MFKCGRVGEVFIAISSIMHQVRGPVGDKKAPLLQFSPLLLPTLPKFAHFAHLRLGKLSKPVPHLEDGGDFESKTSIQLNAGAFYHTQQTEEIRIVHIPSI